MANQNSIRITNFIDGLNTRDDARKIKPYDDKDSTAEAVEMLNMEITSEGSLATSTGFEAVASLDIEGGFKDAWALEVDYQTTYIILVQGNKLYSYVPGISTLNELGSYGDEASQFAAQMAPDYADEGKLKLYIVNDNEDNEVAVCDGLTVDFLPSAPKGGQAISLWMGRLFIAKGSRAIYSETDDYTDWTTPDGGEIKFGDLVTGFEVEGERLVVLTRTFNQGIQFQYDNDLRLSIPLKEAYERKFGAIAPNAITRINADVFYLAEEVEAYQLGGEVVDDGTGIPRPRSLSSKIDPTLKLANQEAIFSACTEYFNKQWLVAMPFGSSTYNDRVFKWNENFSSWTIGFGYYPSSFVKTKDDSGKTSLYFSSAVEPKLFKFNKDYLFDGSGYLRKWKSKKFTMQASGIFKLVPEIEIAGSMYTSTIFYVKVTADGRSTTFVVNNTQLENSASGNYIGDDYIGDAYIGGSEPNESAFKRYRAKLPMPDSLREAFEYQVEIFNTEPNQPFKVDEITIPYDYRPQKQIPGNHIVKKTI